MRLGTGEALAWNSNNAVVVVYNEWVSQAKNNFETQRPTSHELFVEKVLCNITEAGWDWRAQGIVFCWIDTTLLSGTYHSFRRAC